MDPIIAIITRKMRVYIPSDSVISPIFNLGVKNSEEALSFILLYVYLVYNDRILTSFVILCPLVL